MKPASSSAERSAWIAPGSQVPMAIPQGVWWVGIFWFAFMAVLIPLQAMARLLKGDRDGFEVLIGSLRVTDEISQAGVEQPVRLGDRP